MTAGDGGKTVTLAPSLERYRVRHDLKRKQIADRLGCTMLTLDRLYSVPAPAVWQAADESVRRLVVHGELLQIALAFNVDGGVLSEMYQDGQLANTT